MSDRSLISLQEQVTHLDRRVDQLNEVVTGLSMNLLKRDRQLDRLIEEIRRLKRGDEESPPDDEKPPHY